MLCTVHIYSNIRFFGFIKLYKKSADHCIFLHNQILVNSHWELNLTCTSKKNKCKSNNWLGLLYAHKEICAYCTFQLYWDNEQITKSVYHDCMKFIDVLESFISKSDHARNWNMLFAYICLCAKNYITNKSSQFFYFLFLFLDVHVRFSSQCELTDNWPSNKKQCSGTIW